MNVRVMVAWVTLLSQWVLVVAGLKYKWAWDIFTFLMWVFTGLGVLLVVQKVRIARPVVNKWVCFASDLAMTVLLVCLGHVVYAALAMAQLCCELLIHTP